MSFSVWKNVKIKDVAETIFSGGTPSTKKEEFWNGKINWLSSGETRNKFIVDTEKKITQEGVDNSSTKLAKKKDVVIASAGQGFTRGQTSMCLIDTYINQSLICVRAKKDIIDPYYLFYNISSRYNELRQISDGHSIRGSLTTKLISDLNISLPTIDEQRKIREILFSIDNKIETNNEINKKLEEMAQAIFKQWFVDFEFPNEDGKPYKSSGGEMVESELGMIPKGWEVKTIGDLANVVSKGTTPRKNDIDNALDENSIKFIKVKDISDDGIIDLTNIEYIPESVHVNQLKRSILAYKDILLSIAGTIGRVSYVDEEVKNSNTNQAVAFIRLIDINMYFLLVFYKFKSYDFQNSIHSKVVQGVQANISLTVIKNEKIIIPNDVMLEKYNQIVNSIFNKKDIVNKENNRLKSIRDELLPKLMSGEIRVPVEN